MQSVWINAKLPGLNEYINACRSNAYTGAKKKKDVEQLIAWQIIRVKPIVGAVASSPYNNGVCELSDV